MAVTKKGKSAGILSTGGLNKPLKMVKMIQARCKECNPGGQGPRGWWEECPHDPYVSKAEKEIKKPVLKETEDGRTLKVGEEVEIEYILTPNWKQIADDAKVASGRMVRIQQERGSKFPEELGYAPICDYFNCWQPNPKFKVDRVIEHEGVQTVIGKYHTRDEAAMMTLRLTSTPVFVGVDQDINRRREQLNSVQI